ncbi:MAG: hypothetical protein NXH90_03760 [Flavobacteriaceae bacterium]|nr:hypothetical protein [Flavobacteriaceae bacterium]
MKPSKPMFPIIALSQICCTSLWFSDNRAIQDLVHTFGPSDGAVGYLT